MDAAPAMIEVVHQRCTDLAATEREWRRFEAATDCSFFTSATWMFCQAAQRFSAPELLRAGPADAPAAMALFNRRTTRLGRKTYWLGESGEPDLDAVFIEHNGLLVRAPGAPCVVDAMHRAMLERFGRGMSRIVLNGVEQRVADALAVIGAQILVRATRPSPRVEFGALGGSYLASLSANTRYQLRRSVRHYAERGSVSLARAHSVETAWTYFDELIALHQGSWNARGKPGGFANPRVASFHRELIARGFPRDEIDLLRVCAGRHVIGLLYNFRHRGRVYAYQSGFAYEDGAPHLKPGLTCHLCAIEHYRRINTQSYDFLGGADRYKTSLANASDTLVWLEATHAASMPGRLRRMIYTVRPYVHRSRFRLS